MYLLLAKEAADRQGNDVRLLADHIAGELVMERRSNRYNGILVGNDRLREELEALTGRQPKS